MGVIDHEVRYEQTLKTIESIRERAPGSIIMLLDSSPEPVEEFKFQTIKSKVDYFISLFNHSRALELGNMGLKSPAECYIMIVALDIIQNLNIPDIRRIFKITGRAELTDNFNIDYYDDPALNGKYVFQTPVISWMSPSLKLVNTRLWSFSYDLLDEVNQIVRAAYNDCMNTNYDLEHVYYKLINKDKLVGQKVIGLKCQVAGNGVMVDE